MRLVHVLPDARSLGRVLRPRLEGIVAALFTASKQTWGSVGDRLGIEVGDRCKWVSSLARRIRC